ncbi:MAG: hypothetical protein UZ03_NOB001003537 [Nitrospira sp. OLB3]|nr:MAG: hypothetical protein UZ03_NOB001003537 [Nitrospira sp. OLB3]
MSISTHPPFECPHNTLRDWRAEGLLTDNHQALSQFRSIAPVSLLPIMKDLHEALEAEGLRATVRDTVLDFGVLSLTIDDFDVEVSFAPDDIPNLCRMITCRMGTPQSSLTRLLAYQDLDTDRAGVMGLVEESVLRALAPRRATGPDPLGEPSTTLG